MPVPHVAVLGGGLAGLVAAYTLRRALPSARVTLLERSLRLGGWLHSERVSGFLFERGCRGLRPSGASGPQALRLVDSLGLSGEALPASPAAATRFLLHRGSLAPLPRSALAAARSPLTRGAAQWLLRDLLAPAGPAAASAWAAPFPAAALAADESVAAFAGRHFGPHVARVLLDAALGGIYAGDVDALSARSVLGALWRAEADGAWGGGARASVALGLLRARLGAGGAPAAGAGAPPQTPPLSADLARAAASASVSFREGMGALPAALAAALRTADVRLGAGVEALAGGARAAGGCEVGLEGGGALRADALVCALPAPALARVLARGRHPAAAAAAAAVPFASVAAVGLGWRGAHAAKLRAATAGGFGFLVPRGERSGAGADPLLGMTWDSTVFPGQAARVGGDGGDGGGECRLTVMLGGATAPEVEGWSEARLLAAALRAVGAHLGGPPPPPDGALPALARRAIPQYTVGHSARVAAVEAGLRAALPGVPVALVGNSWRGVGAADTVAGAAEGAEAVAAQLQRSAQGAL